MANQHSVDPSSWDGIASLISIPVILKYLFDLSRCAFLASRVEERFRLDLRVLHYSDAKPCALLYVILGRTDQRPGPDQVAVRALPSAFETVSCQESSLTVEFLNPFLTDPEIALDSHANGGNLARSR